MKYELKIKRALLAAVLMLGCFDSFAQPGGTVNFCNNSSAPLINGPSNRPVVIGDGVQAALYWAATGTSNFVQIGAATNAGVPLPGLFAGGTHFAGALTPGGATGQFQVKAWGGGFLTYELAVQNGAGVLLGQSAILQVPTGNPAGVPPTPAASLVANGLQSFTVTPAIPPPPTAVDIGLRIYDGTTTNKLAAEPPGQLTSALRINKNGTNYGILLVATNATNASKLRVQTSSGVKAVEKLP